jgi:hypothetical protein
MSTSPQYEREPRTHIDICHLVICLLYYLSIADPLLLVSDLLMEV